MVQLLVERGADITVTGRDRRRPRAIARAAGRTEVTAWLEAKEKERGVWEDPASQQRYCKAYYLRDLKKFSAFREGRREWNVSAYWPDEIKGMFEKKLEPDDVVFIHQDLSVTRSMWHGEHVIFDDASPEWSSFCRDTLQFAVPDDLA